MSLIEDYGYIEFESIKDDWTEYLLDDDTLIRLKSIPLKAMKIDGEVRLNLQKILIAFSPKNMKGTPDSKTYFHVGN